MTSSAAVLASSCSPSSAMEVSSRAVRKSEWPWSARRRASASPMPPWAPRMMMGALMSTSSDVDFAYRLTGPHEDFVVPGPSTSSAYDCGGQAQPIQTMIEFQKNYAQLPDSFHVAMSPVPVQNPRLIAFNRDLADLLGLDLSDSSEDELAALFAGN